MLYKAYKLFIFAKTWRNENHAVKFDTLTCKVHSLISAQVFQRTEWRSCSEFSEWTLWEKSSQVR